MEVPEVLEVLKVIMKQLKQATSNDLVAIEHIADTWEVSPKTVGKWSDIIYLAFDIRIPKVGPYPVWAVSLLEICAKHISEKATLYFPETQEARRLKGNEFIRKIRHLRQEGHFQEFQKFQKFQNFQPEQPAQDDDELETLGELAAIAESQDEQLFNAQQTFEAREDEQIEKLVTFIENSEQRRMGKLARRLKTRQLSGTTADQALDVSFRRLN